MEPTQKEKSILDGLLLSDGYLECRSINARFKLTSKHRSFVDSVVSSLPSFSWAEPYERDVFDKRTLKSYHTCKLDSHANAYLGSQHSRWYQNGKKIVPSDLVIDKDVLQWWYIGDGHLVRKKSRPNYRRVILCTDCFLEQEIELLCVKLRSLLHEKSVYREGSKIAIASQAMVAMAKMLTECPVLDYTYKYDFGNYRDDDYFAKTYAGRPLETINAYRREHKVRELNYAEIKGS
jgi:hypothetical protein